MNATDWKTRLTQLMTTPRVWGGPQYGAGDTTAGLVELCCEWIKPDCVMVEVGCFRGVSTRVFALFARGVYAVDAWTKLGDNYTDLPCALLAKAEAEYIEAVRDYHNIVTLRGFSVTVSSMFDGASLDAVYLDGDHREEAFAADVRAWLPKLKPTGLLMGHDFSQVGNYFAGLGLPKPAKVYSEDSWVIKAEDIAWRPFTG